MDSPTPHEVMAMSDAGMNAGQYLESTGKTDLTTLTGDEWNNFVEVVCTGYVDSMRQRAGMVMMDITFNNGMPPLHGG